MRKIEQKISVGILGATGAVGQKFVEMLSTHPWFSVTALTASERSVGKPYREACQWRSSIPLPSSIGEMIVQPCTPDLPCRLVFSGLDASVAGSIEEDFARAGYIVISNSKNHRMRADVPLLIPEVNPDHLGLLKSQSYKGGMIVTNPNCSVVGLAMGLKPLVNQWGIDQIHVVTMQAVSGAGYPGVSSLDIYDNIIPYIGGEEEKIETEPLKIFGKFQDHLLHPTLLKISAHSNRVPVLDGHTLCVSVKLNKKAARDDMIEAWQSFSAEPQALELPLAPKRPLVYFEEAQYPQPRLHRHIEQGMSVAVGRLRPCSLLDWKFTLLCNNTVRGAAGCAILNAELMVAKKLF